MQRSFKLGMLEIQNFRALILLRNPVKQRCDMMGTRTYNKSPFSGSAGFGCNSEEYILMLNNETSHSQFI